MKLQIFYLINSFIFCECQYLFQTLPFALILEFFCKFERFEGTLYLILRLFWFLKAFSKLIT